MCGRRSARSNPWMAASDGCRTRRCRYVSLIRQRWQLIERQGSNIRLVVVGILVFWVAAIFASFGLNAPRNATVVVAFLVCALSIGGAVFLILEMDSPFQGVLRLSKQPLTNALAHMQL